MIHFVQGSRLIMLIWVVKHYYTFPAALFEYISELLDIHLKFRPTKINYYSNY